MKNKELIEHLKTFDMDLLVMIRYEDPCGGPDYWSPTAADIQLTDVLNSVDGSEIAAVTIGDERNG